MCLCLGASVHVCRVLVRLGELVHGCMVAASVSNRQCSCLVVCDHNAYDVNDAYNNAYDVYDAFCGLPGKASNNL